MDRNVFTSLKHGNFLNFDGKAKLLILLRDKMPVQKAACESLEYNNGTQLVRTGTLVTINNELENNAIRNVRFPQIPVFFSIVSVRRYESTVRIYSTDLRTNLRIYLTDQVALLMTIRIFIRDYINAINSPDQTINNPYAWIGLRKVCRDCSWHWINDEPFTYANWYGNEPDTITSECAHIRYLYIQSTRII